MLRLAMLVMLAPAATVAGQSIWYVDAQAPADGDGTSWDTAFVELQSAMAVATHGDAIHIAGGIYRPDYDVAIGRHTGDRAAAFVLAGGVSLIGGFAGSAAADPQDHNPELYETVLSGDLAGDDGPDFQHNNDNSYHVVTATDVDPAAVLDGLTITGGNANGQGAPASCFGGPNSGAACDSDKDCAGTSCISVDSIGAGLYLTGSSPTITRCNITANFAAFQGAGMQLKNGSNPAISDCLFSFNRALDNGGAIYAGGSSPLLSNCLFLANSGKRYAGAICNRDLSNAFMVDCIFRENTAAEEESTGGGAIVNASSSPTMVNCLFENNAAIMGNGGALYNKFGFNPDLGGSAPLVLGCTFTGNSATTGGGVYNEDADPILQDCTFTDNDAAEGQGGGAVWSAGGNPVITDCTFLNNRGYTAGAVYSGNHANTTIDNCLFSGNLATQEGGGGIANAESDGLISRCTFIDNTAAGEILPVGGAISMYLSKPLVRQCQFINNDALYGGGGFYSETVDGGPTIERCSFRGNTAPYGAAIHNFFSSPLIHSCLLAGNVASALGGGIYNDFGSDPQVLNCTIVANSAAEGGGLHNQNIVGAPVMTNCILWDNMPDQIAGLPSPPTTVNHSNIEGGWSGAGIGNMDEDPVFVDPPAGDYHLQDDSPCIDAGDDTAIQPDGLDIDDQPRLSGSAVDLGADEVDLACAADLFADGSVNAMDLALLLGAWDSTAGGPADLNGDGIVNAVDLTVLLAEWGTCP